MMILRMTVYILLTLLVISAMMIAKKEHKANKNYTKF